MSLRTLRTLRTLLLLSLVLPACSDDAGEDNNVTTCATGEVFNPVIGACAARPSNTAQDQGTVPTDMGSTPTEDMGTEPTPDMSTPIDMALPQDCVGNERRCNGEVVEACINGMFTVQQTCGDGMMCERGNCVPEDNGMCTPGATRCAGTQQMQTCEADGVTWTTASCGMGETCMGTECTAGCAGFITEKSNAGCEYFSMRHNQASGLRVLPHTVVVSNPQDMAVTIQVDSPGGTNPNIPMQTIQPLDSAVLNFPTSPMISTNGVSSNIYMIRASRPVIATQFAPLNNPGLGSETSDASLLLPTNALGQEYVVLGWRGLQPGGTYVDIVALEDGTAVTVQSPLPLSGGAAGNVAANSSGAFTVNASQVLHLSENRSIFDSGSRDVSGVIITATKPVAVYTGGTIVNIPDEPVRVNPPGNCTTTGTSCTQNDQCCSGVCGYSPQTQLYACADGLSAGDHVEQQLFPVDTWGTSYVATPFWSRGTDDFSIYRIVGATDGTMVTLDPPVNGESSFTLNRGQVHQIYGPGSFELTASNPVMLAQFMIGGSISPSGDGDPAFLIPPAVEQFRDSYVFLVPGNYNNNYVTLVKQAGTQIDLDGVTVAQAQFQPVGGASTWEYAIINSVTAGVHRANSTDAFGVVVHGMDEYISYAFAGGIVLPD